MIISVSTEIKDGIYDSKVDIKGSSDVVLIELKTLFESIIQSENPELIHAVSAYFLPKLTTSIEKGAISETKIAHFYEYLRHFG